MSWAGKPSEFETYICARCAGEVRRHPGLVTDPSKVYCSQACFQASRKRKPRKPRVRRARKSRKYDARYRTWRTAVLVRDEYKCVRCGASGKVVKLEAHHIVRWARSRPLRYVVENGMTLCVACHDLEHKWRRRKRNA